MSVPRITIAGSALPRGIIVELSVHTFSFYAILDSTKAQWLNTTRGNAQRMCVLMLLVSGFGFEQTLKSRSAMRP